MKKPKLIIIVERGSRLRLIKQKENKYDLLEAIEVNRGDIDRIRVIQVGDKTVQIEKVELPDETD
jgi:hypothetical protein